MVASGDSSSKDNYIHQTTHHKSYIRMYVHVHSLSMYVHTYVHTYIMRHFDSLLLCMELVNVKFSIHCA